jgi:glycosyltransferase involved in cell wall biosynthesis
MDFDLVIVDNHSTDGTGDYLVELLRFMPTTRIKINPANFGFRGSLLIGLEFVNTDWLTILCDDDILCENFVETFYHYKSKFSDATCLAFSAHSIDQFGCVLDSQINDNKFISPEIIINSIGNLEVKVAGVSNFCFLYDHSSLRENHLIKDYPNGFFIDSFLFLVSSLRGGLVTSSEITYKRREWSGQLSSFSNEIMFDRFVALMQYDSDVRSVISEKYFYKINYRFEFGSLQTFVKSFIFQIATLGYLSPKLCALYLKSAWRFNKRYLPHALLMTLMLPFLLKSTLGIRKWSNEFRKKIRKSQISTDSTVV